MIAPRKTLTHLRVWFVLHIILGVASLIVLSSLLSCMRAKEEPADLGEEVPFDKIEEAMVRGTEGASLARVAKDQFVFYTQNQRIENEEVTRLLGSLRVLVQEGTQQGNSIRFPLKIERQSRNPDNSFSVKLTEDAITVPIKNSTSASSHSARRPLPVSAFAEPNAEPGKVTFHRLRETTATVPPPALVRYRPGCGGLSPCEMNVRKVQFDAVKWKTNTDFDKVAIDFTLSVAPPYLPFGEGFDQWTGVLISDCRSTYVPIQGRTVYVRECHDLEDFQK